MTADAEIAAQFIWLAEVEQGRQRLAEAAADLAAAGITASLADATVWSQSSRRQREKLSDQWLVYMASENDFK